MSAATPRKQFEAKKKYSTAYQLQYGKLANAESKETAATLYREIIRRWPSAEEAAFASAQLEKLTNSNNAKKISSSSSATPAQANGESDGGSVPAIGITGEELYSLAYEAHWKDKDFVRARTLYHDVVTRFAGSEHAKYARTQLANLAADGGDKSAERRRSGEAVGASSKSLLSREPSADSRKERTRRDLLRSSVTTGSISDAHAIVRPIRVIVPVARADSSKARLSAFDTATLWLAAKAVELEANMVIAARFEEVSSGSKDARHMEIVATGTAVRVFQKSEKKKGE